MQSMEYFVPLTLKKDAKKCENYKFCFSTFQMKIGDKSILRNITFLEALYKKFGNSSGQKNWAYNFVLFFGQLADFM